jgi:hypothetical protein
VLEAAAVLEKFMTWASKVETKSTSNLVINENEHVFGCRSDKYVNMARLMADRFRCRTTHI